MVNFPKTKSKEILHYVYVHLENPFTDDTKMVHVGVNDLLNDYIHPTDENLVKNLDLIEQK